ncbi:hypothetical protein BJ546DRAFT_850069 [Cryomyces antarcticus]
MSVTTTADSARYSTLSYLADYELHHSGSTNHVAPQPNAHPDPRRSDPSSSTHSDTPTLPNPIDWRTDHRRIPPYRPINRELDQSQRRVYTSVLERVFITVMFMGMFLQNISQVWAATGGRVAESWFRYKIGGEW